MADHSIYVRGPPLKASQRRLGRARARGKPPAAAAPATLTPGASVRWRGRAGLVDRLPNPIHAVVDFNGKRWLVPIDELEAF
jgi:hypothetical protein